MTVRTKVYSLLGVLLVAGAAGAVWKFKPAWLKGVPAANAAAPDPNAPKEATPVQLAIAKSGEISSFITATANLRALRELSVATQAEGIVQKVLVEEGDTVDQGQLLCQLDDTQLNIRLKLAQEKLEQARYQMDKAKIRDEKTNVQMANARIELNRYEAALKEGVVSEQEVASHRYRVDELTQDRRLSSSEATELQHHVAELEAEIAQSKLDISRTQVLAPFAGQITQRTVTAGQRVRALDALFNLGAFAPLQADVHLSEKDARLVHPGQAATVKLGADETAGVRGHVERIAPVVDQSSGTVKVTVALDPAPGFRPGSFVRVDIRTDTKAGALLIPKKAVLEEDGQSYVYITSGDSAKRTKVELGYSSEGMIEIRNGLTAGQKVVVAGQGALKEGSKIKVI